MRKLGHIDREGLTNPHNGAVLPKLEPNEKEGDGCRLSYESIFRPKNEKGKQWSQFIFAFDMCIFFREVWVVAARGQLDQ